MKRTVCALLAILLAVSAFSASAFAAKGDDYVGVGNVIVEQLADATTMAVPSEFGVAYRPATDVNGGAADGRVWVDKSVQRNENAGELTGSFDITLSAMAQEYAMPADERSSLAVKGAADVLFILDFSTSMTDSSSEAYSTAPSDKAKTELVYDEDANTYITRFEAMTRAVNLAVKQIMTANKNNRIMICWYAGRNTTQYGVVVPLGSYCVQDASGKEHTDQDFFVYEASSGYSTSFNFKTVSGFAKVGGSKVSYSKTRDGGTYSQKGIAAGAENFISQAKKQFLPDQNLQ